MPNDVLFTDQTQALRFLTWAKSDLLQADEDSTKVMQGRDQVLQKFGPIFREAGSSLTESAIKDFLSFEENCHWTGLYRQQSAILSNFDKAKLAIGNLVRKPEYGDNLAERFDAADRGVRGFGQGIISPILFVAFPNDYGVWNSKSETGLNLLGLGIVSDRGDSPGRKYEKINGALWHVRKNLNLQLTPGDHPIDFWTLDYFWHALKVMGDDGRLNALVNRFKSC